MSRDDFVQQISDIDDRVADMADLARGMLGDGVDALVTLDRDRAEEVCTRSDTLAELDEIIEAGILKFLTLQSPVAGDLRRVGTALKLITYLNRVGRYGYDIARVARDWPEGRDHIHNMAGTRDIAQKVSHMLDVVLQAFQDDAAPDVEVIRNLEDDVDALRYSVWRECLTYMAEDPKFIERCAHYMMVARYLERCGDNICKMAEKQHYAATGKRIVID